MIVDVVISLTVNMAAFDYNQFLVLELSLLLRIRRLLYLMLLYLDTIKHFE